MSSTNPTTFSHLMCALYGEGRLPTSEEQKTLDYLGATEVLKLISEGHYRAPKISPRPWTPPDPREMARLLRTDRNKLAEADRAVVEIYLPWQIAFTDAINQAAKHLRVLFDAVDTFERLDRQDERERVERFVQAQYGIDVPFIADRVQRSEEAERLAKVSCKERLQHTPRHLRAVP